MTGSSPATRPILLDTGCTLRMTKEMREWGVHYNQGIHALNTVALRIRHGDRDFTDMPEAAERAVAPAPAPRAARGRKARGGQAGRARGHKEGP